MGLKEEINGSTWTQKAAKAIFPILVWLAKKGKPITYSQLDSLLVENEILHHVMAVQYGKPLGLIGNFLIEYEKKINKTIPPINALIISKEKKLPSKGIDWYLDRYLKTSDKKRKFTQEDKRAIVEEIHSDIYSFKEWDAILKELKLKPFKPKFISIAVGDDKDKVKIHRGGWSSEGESDEHRNLKHLIAKNPHLIGLDEYKAKDAKVEYTFPSADKADIVFVKGEKRTAVEIKSKISNDADISRGIFQCVKYRALLRAEQKAENFPPVADSILVVETKPNIELKQLAQILGVQIIIFQKNN
jgi:hypothetical protein